VVTFDVRYVSPACRQLVLVVVVPCLCFFTFKRFTMRIRDPESFTVRRDHHLVSISGIHVRVEASRLKGMNLATIHLSSSSEP
jgi:hypothetical protein